MQLQRDADPKIVFVERLAALADAAGLSIRDLARRVSVARSTIDGWKHGKALPHSRDHLIEVVRALQAAVSAAGGNGDTWGTTQEWISLLRQAKEARDARAYPARRQPASRNRDAVLGSERRERTIAATSKAMEALSTLLDLDVDPGWQRERRNWAGEDTGEPDGTEKAAVDAWEHQWRELLGVIRMAILDIGDAELKARLAETLQILQLWQGPMKYARQSESRTRFFAATDALEAVGAFRRGDQPPDRSADYLSTRDFVSSYIEELESNSGH
jgi:transcriptional regulator with XRE-family HTH domain